MKKALERPLVSQFILLLLAVIIYGQVYSFGYNLDDEIVLKSQERALSWDGIIETLQAPYFNDDQLISYGYRPLTSLSFYLEAAIFGKSAAVSHVINWCLYLVIVLLIYQVGCFLFKNKLLAFGLAGLYLIHPLHAEVVASIKNRDELLAMFFGLLAIISLRHNTWRSLVSCVLLVLFSLLSKKSGMGILLMAPLGALWMFNWDLIRFRILAICLSVFAFILFPSDFILTKVVLFLSLIGFYLLVDRYQNNYRMTLNWAFFSEAIAVLGLILGVYNLIEFNLDIITLAVVLTVIGYWFNPTKLGGMALVFCVGILSVIGQNWTIIILPGILVGFRNHSIKFTGILLGLFSFLLLYQLASSNKWIVILLAVVFSLPFIFYSFRNKWFLRINIISACIVLAFGLYSFSKWPYVFVIFSILIFSLLHYRNKLRAWLIALGAVMCSLIILVDPSININRSIAPSTSFRNVELTANSGRELHFIENPLVDESNIKNRLIASVNTYAFYVSKFFFPTALSAYYGYNTVDLFSIRTAWWWLLIVATFGFLVWRYAWNRRLLTTILLFILALFPFSNLLIPVAGIVGDRLLFIPSLLLVASLLYLVKILQQKWKRIFSFILIIWSIPLSVQAYQRTALWKNKLTLFTNDVESQPKSVKLNELLADHYYYESEFSNDQRLTEAFTYFQKASVLYPEYERNWYMMGRISQEQRNFELALSYYLKVKDIDFVGVDLYLNTGVCASQSGDFSTADDFLKRAIAIPETGLIAYKQLIILYLKAGNPRLALSASKAALEAYPNEASLYGNHARIYYQLGDTMNAMIFLRKAIELGSDEAQNVQLLEKLEQQIDQ